MSRLPGVPPLDTARDQLPAADRDRLDQTIVAVHQLPPPLIRDWCLGTGQLS